MVESGSPSLKRLRSSLASAQGDYPNKVREISEDSELNYEETEGWRQTLQSAAEEQVKEDAEVESKCSGLMRLEDLDERIRNALAVITSKDPTNGLVEFRKLIQGEDGGNLLQQYVLLSAKCKEIMLVWSSGPSSAYAVPLLQLLCEIMGHPTCKPDSSNDSQHKIASRQLLQLVCLRIDRLARSIITTKLKDIYSHLTSGEPSRQRAALLLMVSIIRRGSMLASDVASTFDFTLNVLPSLAKALRCPKDKKREPKQESVSKPTVRSAFIEFALSFLEVCQAALLRWILQIRPLYSGVLHKLASDDETTILKVLKVFQLRVLDSSGMVPPGLQSAVFGDSTLEQLVIISSNASYLEAAQAAHDTLLELCTDPAHGICPEATLLWAAFPGRTGGFGGGQGRLVRLMVKLRATEIQNHRDLLLSIAARRPLLVAAYLESFPYSLEPRISTAWFAAAALLSDILLVTKVLPPFESLATQGLPPPLVDSSLFQGVLRSVLPRNLTRVLINRGLLHANMLVKHGCLRILLEVLSAVEFYVNSISKARWSLQDMSSIRESSPQRSSGTIMSKKLESFDGSSDYDSSISDTESILDSMQPCSKELDCSQKWWALELYFKNELRAFAPDPQVLFSLLSLKSVNMDSASDTKKKECSEVLVLDDDRLERDGLLADGAGSPSWDHEDHSEGSIASVVDIWNAGSEIQVEDMKDSEAFLNAKVLEVLAVYQRILPMALVESSLDVFKILPEDPSLLTLSQQKALLMLLKAVSGEGFGQNVNELGLESLQLRHMFKHLKPLLKLTLVSKDEWVRKGAQSLARRAMISSGAFESSNNEVEIWLHFLPLSDKTVLFFLCDAVETVGRNIDKYVDTLLFIIHSAANQDGILTPQCGPFVVCVIDKCLRVLASSTKNLKITERTSIAIYVANVLDLLMQSQVHPQPLRTIINALLSGKVDINARGFRSEWSPLKNLLTCVKRHLRGVDEVPSLFVASSVPQTFSSNGSIAAVLKSCKDDETSSVEMKAFALSSCLTCTPLQEVVGSLPMLMEIYFSMLKGKLAVLTDLFGAYKWLLSAVAKAWPELFEKSLELASNLAHSKIVTAKKVSLLGELKQASIIGVTPVMSSSSSDAASFAFSVFLLGLPFSTIFPAATNFNEAELLRSCQCQGVLKFALSNIPPHLWLHAANLIMYWIAELQSLHCQGSDVECQLDVCFSLLKLLILPSEEHGWFALLKTEENAGAELDLIIDLIRGVVSHPIMNVKFRAAKNSLGDVTIQLEEKDRLSFQSPQLLESWFLRGARELPLLENHIVDIFKELLHWGFEIKNKHLPSAFVKVQKVLLVSCKAFLNEVLHAVKTIVVESHEKRSGGFFPSVVTYTAFAFFRFIDVESMVDLSCTLLSKELISQEANNGDFSTLWVPYHIVGLYFATSTFKRIAFLLQQKDQQSCSVPRESLMQNLYEKVLHVVLTRPAEMAFACLLSALEAHCGFSYDGWLHKSSAAVLSSCIHTTPVELLSHLIEGINQTKAKIILELIQSGQPYLSEFSNVLVHNLPSTSLMLRQSFSCSDRGRAQCLFKEMILLLPSVNWLINALLYKNDGSHFRIVKEILSVYSNVIMEISKEWDIFAAELDMPEVLPFVKSSENGDHFARFFGCTTPGQVIVMFKHCLAHDQFSVKEKAKLFSSVVEKKSPLLNSYIRDISKLSTESLLKLVSVTIAKSMMAKLLVLSEASSENANSSDNSLPESCCVETEDVGVKSTKVANILVHTLGMLFKLEGMEVQNTNNTLELSGFQVKISKLKLLHLLEMALLKHLRDVLKTTISIQHEAQFMSMLKKFTKLVLRFRFGEQLPMQVLRSYALKAVHLPDLSRKYASYALELLVGHSQFGSTLLSFVGMSKPNLHVRCCNVSDTTLQSVSSILSVIRSPCKQALTDKSMQPKALHGPEVLCDNSGEDRKLELVKFLRLLYFLKCQAAAVEVLSEQSLDSNELLALLLASYGASLSEVDKEILLLMQEMEYLERSTCTGLKGMDYIWGEAALKLQQRNATNVNNPVPYRFLDEDINKEVRKKCFKDLMLNPFKCALGVLFFPVRRNLFNIARLAGGYEEEEKVYYIAESDEDVLKDAGYDPRFMLPFALHNLSSRWINTEDFVLKGLLALTLVSIASCCEDMRKLGYEILATFLSLMEEGPSFKGKPQIRLLLTYVKNSVLEPLQQLPFVAALFAAEASCILMNPSDVHYTAVIKFLFRAPGIDLEAIPLFKSMFGSGSIYFRADRAWILRLVSFGLRTSFDTHVYRCRFILEILMSFYGSPLGDRHTREWTLQILHRASKLRSLVQYLVEHAGLLSWLTLIIFSNGAAKSGEYAGGLSIELTLEALQILENILMWRSVKRWLISEGFEELSKTVVLLHCHALQNLNSSEPAAFLRPYLRILGTTFSLSQARKKFQSHLNFSLADFDGIIQLVERERAPNQATRLLALRSILESEPPACFSFQDKTLLHKFGTWALDVVLQDFFILPYRVEDNPNDKENSSKSNQKEDPKPTVLRWLAASLILGESQRRALLTGPSTAWTFFDRVPRPDETACASDFEVNKNLARLLVCLQCLSGRSMASSSMVSVACACGLLLKSVDGPCGAFFEKFQDIAQGPLEQLSCPMEVDTSWRWKLSNNMEVHSKFDQETCQILFSSFQKLLYVERKSELHNTMEMLHLNLRDYKNSMGGINGLTCSEATVSQSWINLKLILDGSNNVLQKQC